MIILEMVVNLLAEQVMIPINYQVGQEIHMIISRCQIYLILRLLNNKKANLDW